MGSDPQRHPAAIPKCPKLAKQLAVWHLEPEPQEAPNIPLALRNLVKTILRGH